MNKSVDSKKKKKKISHFYAKCACRAWKNKAEHQPNLCQIWNNTSVEIFGQHQEISVNEWWSWEIVNNGLRPEDRLALDHIVGDLWQMWTGSFFGLWTSQWTEKVRSLESVWTELWAGSCEVWTCVLVSFHWADVECLSMAVNHLYLFPEHCTLSCNINDAAYLFSLIDRSATYTRTQTSVLFSKYTEQKHHRFTDQYS